MANRAYLNHTAIAVGSMIFVYGGKILGSVEQQGKKYEKCSNELRILHTETMQWEIPKLGQPEGQNAPSKSMKQMLVVYSRYASILIRKLLWLILVGTIYGFVKGTSDCPRSEHTATLVDNLLYIIGGWTSSNPAMHTVDTTYLNDVQILNLETMSWEITPTLPLFINPRSMHTSVQVNNEIWVFGGRNSASPALSDWQRLNLPHKPTEAGKSNEQLTVTVQQSVQKIDCIACFVFLFVEQAAAKASTESKPAKAPKPVQSGPAPISDESVGSGSILDAFKADMK